MYLSKYQFHLNQENYTNFKTSMFKCLSCHSGGRSVDCDWVLESLAPTCHVALYPLFNHIWASGGEPWDL